MQQRSKDEIIDELAGHLASILKKVDNAEGDFEEIVQEVYDEFTVMEVDVADLVSERADGYGPW